LLKRIAITGPESTGKTRLATELSACFHTALVPEYAVSYLDKHGPHYTADDILQIARGQLKLENEMAKKGGQLLFCDTDLLVTKIWSLVVFGKVPQWIDKVIVEHPYDLYLLCYPDLEWQPAPYRENPEDREYLFDLYEKEVKDLSVRYRIVKGKGQNRLDKAIAFVNEVL